MLFSRKNYNSFNCTFHSSGRLFPRKKPRTYEKQILIFMQLFKYLKFKTEKYGNLSQKTHFDWHELVEMNGQRHLNGAFMNIKEMKYNFEKWTKLRNRSRSSIITRYANEQLVVIKKLNVIEKKINWRTWLYCHFDKWFDNSQLKWLESIKCRNCVHSTVHLFILNRSCNTIKHERANAKRCAILSSDFSFFDGAAWYFCV